MISKRHMRRLYNKQRELYLNRLVGDISINDRETGPSRLATEENSASSRQVVHTENLTAEHNNAEPVRECSGCRALDAKINNLNETLRDLKDTMLSVMSSQHTAVMTALADQEILMSKFVSQDAESSTIKSSFPLLCTEDLIKIEAKVVPENRSLFVSTLRNLLRDAVAKNLQKVLSIDIILDYNIDGTHGKKSLKDYKKFYSVFLESIISPTSNDDPELQLRKAIQLRKKRAFQKKGSATKAIKTEATKD